MATGSTSSSTSAMDMRLPSSMPFAADTAAVPAWRWRLASMATWRIPALGTAKTTSSAPSRARERLALAPSEGGSFTPGK